MKASFPSNVGKARRIVRVCFVLVALLSAIIAFRSWLNHKSNIVILPYLPGANWVVYPYKASASTHLDVEMEAEFSKTFSLQAAIPTIIRVTALRKFTLKVNGTDATPSSPLSNWKVPERIDISNLVRIGTNEISVTAANSNGPPALWLCSASEGLELHSDRSWKVSFAGAVWKLAQLATEPREKVSGEEICSMESPMKSVRVMWPFLCCMFGAAGAMVWCLNRYGPVSGWIPFWGPIVILGLMWLALMINNLGALPLLYGYDSNGHLAYIKYLQEKRSLPQANEGWEMFQPPLYYILAATLLSAFGLSITSDMAPPILRILGLLFGLLNLGFVLGSLRLLFPGTRREILWGLFTAGCLPPVIYLSHYVTNEVLAACLMSAVFYYVLRTLTAERAVSFKHSLALGLFLGLALLAKSTALLLVPIVIATLFWKFRARGWAAVSIHLGLCAAVISLICGWHYYRTWRLFGTPIVGVWDPKTGFAWWQDDGYRTFSFYLRFGSVFLNPWCAGLKSFWDGIYSTLWGEGLLGGVSDVCHRPPWNYNLMATGYVLALIPSAAVLVGMGLAVAKVLKERSMAWLMTLAFAGLSLLAIIHLSLIAPFYCSIKAFYGLCALIPFCAFAVLGMQLVSRANSMARGLATVLFATWAATSYASFWILSGGVPALHCRVRSWVEEGKSSQALVLLVSRLKEAPHDSRTRSLLVNFLELNESPEKVQKEAMKVLQENPRDVICLLATADSLAKLGDTQESISYARRAIEVAPEYVPARQFLGGLLLNLGQKDEAVQNFQEALCLAPFDADLRLAYAGALFLVGDVHGASSQLNMAFRLRPNWIAGREKIAQFLEAHGLAVEARRYAEEGLRLESGRESLALVLARILIKEGKPGEASEVLRQSIRLHPENAELHCRLASLLDSQKQRNEAIEEYREALRLDPGSIEACNNLAWIRATSSVPESRNGQEAIELAKRACEKTGYAEPQLIGTLAAAYAEAGMFPEAISMASKARDIASARGETAIAQKNEEMILLFKDVKPVRSSD